MDKHFSWMPKVATFIGICGLRWGSILISIFGIVHPACFGVYYTYERVSALDDIATGLGALLTAAYFVGSVILLVGVLIEMPVLVLIFVYITMIFFVMMLGIMIAMAVRFILQGKVWISLGTSVSLLLYLLLFYFAVVANSYRITMNAE